MPSTRFRSAATAPTAVRVAVPYLVLLVLLGADVLTGRDEPLVSSFGAAALVAASLSGPRTTAYAAVVTVAAAVAMSVWEETSTLAALLRLVIVIVFCVSAVALALHEQRRADDYAQVRAVADAAQRALLRPVPAGAAGLQVAARYVSAARLAQVGGDFYEVVPWGGGARLVVGDVKGKGLDSVGLAAVALGAFREAAVTEPSVADVAVRLDSRLRAYLGPEDFVTAVVGELRPGTPDPVLQLLSCGHPAPLLVRDGSASPVPMVSRPPLGLGEPSWWGDDVPGDGTVELAVHPGDRVLLYTDGLVEARDRNRHFVPVQRIVDTLTGPPAAEAPDQALERLLDLLLRSTGGALGDDLALLLLQHPGVPATATPAATLRA